MRKAAAQVQAVAKRLADETPAAIYSSDLGRARDTAQAIQAAIASKPPLRVDARLSEGHFGDWQGQRYADLKVQDAERLSKWEADRLGVAPPNGEALPDLGTRVYAAYRGHLQDARGRDRRHRRARRIAPGAHRAGTRPATRSLLAGGRVERVAIRAAGLRARRGAAPAQRYEFIWRASRSEARRRAERTWASSLSLSAALAAGSPTTRTRSPGAARGPCCISPRRRRSTMRCGSGSRRTSRRGRRSGARWSFRWTSVCTFSGISRGRTSCCWIASRC